MCSETWYTATLNTAMVICAAKPFMFIKFFLNYERLTAPAGRAFPPVREAPKLDAPRALLAWALALLDAPPKALAFREASLLEIRRLPILFPPPLFRFALVLLGRAPGLEVARFAAELPALLGFTPDEPGRFMPGVLRLPPLDCGLLLNPCCCRAFAWRVDMESPRAEPPYLFAVALSE